MLLCECVVVYGVVDVGGVGIVVWCSRCRYYCCFCVCVFFCACVFFLFVVFVYKIIIVC